LSEGRILNTSDGNEVKELHSAVILTRMYSMVSKEISQQDEFEKKAMI
jgi:flagellar basal body rod protein FlgG